MATRMLPRTALANEMLDMMRVVRTLRLVYFASYPRFIQRYVALCVAVFFVA